MRSSEHANLPRWTGRPGFFEIWFLVVFDPGAPRAWWLRYTTFAPAPGQAGAARATVWAAAFDAQASDPAIAVKRILPLSAYEPGGGRRFELRIGSAELSNGSCRGEVRSERHHIEWDLRFAPAATEAKRGPWLPHRLPLPTHVAHANSDIACSGAVAVDGVRRELRRAPGIQKHIWGTRRVEELLWLYCPRFAEDPAARLEATSVRLRRRLGRAIPTPRLSPLWVRTGEGEIDRCGLGAALRNTATVPGLGRFDLTSASHTRAVRVQAWCEPKTLVGYIYRDPRGWEVHVAQSDVASCHLEILTRAHPLAAWEPARRLTSTQAAALEFQAPEPLPGVRYVAWDAVG